MQLPELSPSTYRRITLVAILALAFIIVTGGAVRLTNSGLGCPDWPTCSQKQFVSASEYHKAIESINRTITGLVSVAVALAVLGSLQRRPRRRDLTRLSLGLVAGVAAQIVLGGLTVLFALKPPFVMAHMMLSLAILACAVVLYERAGEPDVGDRRHVVGEDLVTMGKLVIIAAAVVIFLGTVVTSTGPHGGDDKAERLPFLLTDVARAHGIGVMLFLAITLVTLWRLRRAGAPPALLHRGEILLAVSVGQGTLGYVQYFNGVPPLLVGFHIAGAAAVWAAAVWFALGFSKKVAPTSRPAAVTEPSEAGVAFRA
ncbi:MAG: COX15/CtaA family protein [Actinomycetota bacterium]|nr:COX15/CtaA family protein [Actinomycetota bacterium]